MMNTQRLVKGASKRETKTHLM